MNHTNCPRISDSVGVHQLCEVISSVLAGRKVGGRLLIVRISPIHPSISFTVELFIFADMEYCGSLQKYISQL